MGNVFLYVFGNRRTMKQSDFDTAFENSNDDEPYQRLVNVAEGHGISMLCCQAYEILRETYGEETDWENIVESVQAMTDNQVFQILENFVKENKFLMKKEK